MIGRKVPDVTFRTRVRDESVGGPNPYCWQAMTTDDYFKNRRVVVFSLPGAFTPTCSTFQLPGFEQGHAEIQSHGIDDIYCISVNDAFVMNAWGKQQNITKDQIDSRRHRSVHQTHGQTGQQGQPWFWRP